MTRVLDPFRLVLIAVSGWMNRRQLRSSLWRCEWRKRTGIGAIDESRARCPILATSLPAARSLRFWNDTEWNPHRSGAGRRHDLIVFNEATLCRHLNLFLA